MKDTSEIAYILQSQVQSFIAAHLQTDVSTLALQKNPFPEISWQTILQQIQAKQKCEHKLPTWYKTPQIIYPQPLSVEQTSSEATAGYKAQFFKGGVFADLTGGLGVDTFYFSKRFSKAFHIEQNGILSQIAAHNFRQLDCPNITCIQKDGIAFVQESSNTFDLIYIDPARRDEHKSKVFLLDECTPNVLEYMSLLCSKAKHILIKTSPLLDIQDTLRKMPNISTVYILAVDNEVKELLFRINTDTDITAVTIHTANIRKNGNEVWEISLEQSNSAETYSYPKAYLYLPNAAIMKSGQFAALGNNFDCLKLHKHSHLYTSDTLKDFPGRRFQVTAVIPYNKKHFKQLQNIKANISTRNFPVKPEALAQKHKITQGGDAFLFFTTLEDEGKVVLFCKPV